MKRNFRELPTAEVSKLVRGAMCAINFRREEVYRNRVCSLVADKNSSKLRRFFRRTPWTYQDADNYYQRDAGEFTPCTHFRIHRWLFEADMNALIKLNKLVNMSEGTVFITDEMADILDRWKEES